MNKKIFSLVCIVLYVLLAVSIHCSEKKENKIKHRAKRVIQKLFGRKEDDSQLIREAQLKKENISDFLDDMNDNEYGDVYYGEYTDDEDSFDKMIEKFINDNKDLPMDILGMETYVLNILENESEQSKFSYKLYKEILKQHSKLKPSE
ncbi:hypothetical protein YYE_03999 [Plasmodium vinckei vinckei]|uniref:Fam-c protein n=2 Tax=Plasmodium vinckei vinckei TaxID=54757 RepID=A0A081IBA8_PLAVN|nr:hypothetical protein YYE_03999 [Plasmodium vinckei vinckei]